MKKTLIFGLMFLLLINIALAETISYDDFECNGFGCGTGWNNNWTITGAVAITTLSAPQGVYMLRGQNGGIATRNFDNSEYSQTTISFWATATSLEATDYCRYYYYDGTNYIQLLQIADGQDTGTLQYYTYNVSPVNANAGVRMQVVGATGDYCYMDTITTSGNISLPILNIYLDSQYPINKNNAKIDLTSTQTNINYTLRLYDASNNIFCEKSLISPSVANTVFSTYCNMPATQQTNAKAYIFQTNNQAINKTRFFNVVDYQKDYGKLKIEQVYFSTQVLQGGQTEIFTVLSKDPSLTISKLYTELTFPDNTTRILSMEPTINENEYRAFITDTYRTGATNFKIRVESNVYYDDYSNNYVVAGYNVDFVEVVNQVAEVAVCKKVEEIPNYEVVLSGTEYSPGDRATIFLQLKDSYGQPVANGSCWLDVWWPANASNIHPYTIQDAPMLQALGDDGVYYYDITAPQELGVYMLSAKCSYALNRYEIYDQDDLVNYPVTQTISGTWTGSPIVLNTPHDGLYYKCSGTCQANFTFNTSVYGALSNVTTINNYLYVSTQSGETVTIAYWNGATFVNLANTLLTTSTASGTNAYGYDELLSNTVPVSAIMSNGLVTLRITGTSGTYFFNSFGIDVLTSSGEVQDLKGSSEMHITNIPNATVTLVNNETPAYVWNYTTRNLTYYPPTATAEGVWNYTTRNLTYYQDVTNYTLINNQLLANNPSIAGYVWNNTMRNLTYFDYLTQAGYVWNYTMRNLTYTAPSSVDYTAIQGYVWNATTRNLTYYEDVTNYTYIDLNISYPYYISIMQGLVNIVPPAVWTYTTRNLTYYPAQQDLTNYTLIATLVWNETTRNLTYYPATDTDSIWNYSARYTHGIII